jgi:uncharacterized protein (DUF58 family)
MRYIKNFLSLVYIVVFALLAVLASYIFRSRLLLLTGACVGVAVIADVLFFALFSGFVKIGLETDRLIVKKGESFKIRFIVKNFTPVILSSVAIKFNVKNFYYLQRDEEITAALGAFSYKKINIPVNCTLNGNVRIAVSGIVLGDLLGLMSRNIVCNDVCTVAVIPTEVDNNINKPESSADSDALPTDEMQAVFGDVTGVREYIVGDKLNNIHWKLSAANENADFMVKEFAENMSDAVIVLFEYAKKHTDSVIDSVYSVSQGLIKKGIKFKLMWINGGCEEAVLKSINSSADFDEFILQLYTAYPTDNEMAAMSYFRNITGGENCIYIDGDGTVKK